MSKQYKSNAFRKGGEIVDYIKQFKDYIKQNEYGDFISIKFNYKIKRLKSLSKLLKVKELEGIKGIPYFSCYSDNEFIGFLLLNNKKESLNLSLITGQFDDFDDEEDGDEAVFDFLDLTALENVKYNFLKLKELKNKISKEEYIKINKMAKNID